MTSGALPEVSANPVVTLVVYSPQACSCRSTVTPGWAASNSAFSAVMSMSLRVSACSQTCRVAGSLEPAEPEALLELDDPPAAVVVLEPDAHAAADIRATAV